MLFDLECRNSNAALITEEKEMTYRQLMTLSTTIANAVAERQPVFLFCTNSCESIAAYVGFMNRGVVPAMIDSALDTELASRLIEIYRPAYLFLPENLRENFAAYEETFRIGNYLLLSTGEKNFYPLNAELALLMTTSGSTGSPKFVRQTYKNVQSNTKAIIEYLNIDERDRAITNLPMNYVYGLSVINTHLWAGASIVVTDKTLFQKEFWSLMRDKAVTNFNGVPYTFEMLKRLRFFKMELPALKKITQAGGKLDPELHLKFAEYAERSGKKFFVMYGAAEATARMGYLPAEKALQKIGSMGIAIPGGKFELLDNIGQAVETVDTIGELIYYGSNVAMGYAESGEDLSRGDERHGRLETGDLAKRDAEGYYTIVGRKKRFLKMFGKRVNLQEVEHLLRNKFDMLDVACGGKDDKLTVFITQENLETELIAYLSAKLNLHPSAFSVKVLSAIPKNSAGKIIYGELENLQ